MVAPPGVRLRKVKTGCFTCKTRRVKCDEERPYCRRCTSTGRRCEGYYSTNSLNSEKRAEPPRALSLLPDCSEKERRYFILYNAVTVPNLCAYFGSYFWSTLVPQVSIREPAVQHGLLALSALHESLSSPGGPEHLKERTNVSTMFAIEHYNKAIHHLVDEGSHPSTDTILLCCIIFVCVELLRGNVREALDHIQSGLKVLEDARAKCHAPRPLCISSHPSNVQESLDTVFARLDVQSMFLGSTPQLLLSTPNASHPNNSPPSTVSGIPRMFSNLPEARAHFETLLNSSYRFLRAYPGLQTNEMLSPEAGEAHAMELFKLRAWSDAFDPLFERSRACSDSIQRTAHILKIQHIASLIWIAAHNRQTEAEFGFYTNEFASIIELSRMVMGLPSQTSFNKDVADSTLNIMGPHARPDFAFDFGTMPALHLTAMKCRVPHIRHEALGLIKLTPRQEGVFDRAFVTNLTAYAIEVEETALKIEVTTTPKYASSTGDDLRTGIGSGGHRVAIGTAAMSPANSIIQPQLSSKIQNVWQVSQPLLNSAADDSATSVRSAVSGWTFSQQGKLTDGQTSLGEVPEHKFLVQSTLHIPTRKAYYVSDQVWTAKQEKTLQEQWHRDHETGDDVAGAETVEVIWAMDRHDVAKRASNGAVREQKMGIMGYDASNGVYSFDFR